MTIYPPGLPDVLLPFLAKGLSIFPVRGKIPCTPNGHKDATHDADRWQKWAKEFPGCGWAAPTGETNGFDVLDADAPEAVEELEERLPIGPRVRTGGGGMHFYLRHESGARNWAKRIPGCDYRADGGYVVLPGSPHESGRWYEWIAGTSDLDLPETPGWISDLQRARALPVSGSERYLEGERNDRLFRLASAVRSKGGDVLCEVTRANLELCLPPLEEGEVRQIADSAARYPVVVRAADPTVSRPLFDSGEHPDRAGFVEGAMAHFALAAVQDTEELLVYQSGVYVPHALAVVKSWVEQQYRARGQTASSAFVAEVIAGVVRRSYVPRAQFNPTHSVCLANGVLDLSSLSAPILCPHDPSIRFTVRLPVAFDPSATCTRFDEFMVQVLPEEADRRELRKLFGYCLLPGNEYQLAFMFLGEGSNGKSTLLGVLVALLGSENVSAETLQTLVSNRFAAARLWGKRANVCADIPANPLAFTGTFKLLTGGDPVRGENKFGHPFDFVNGAKLVFSANELPEVSDRTIAFWRRWIIFRFAQSFIGREDRALPDKLRAELSGGLNFALKGLADLVADHGFKVTRSTEALALEWKQRADPIFWFVNTCVERNPGSWISKADLYEAYTQFCEPRGSSYRKLEVFGKLLPTHAPWTRTERRTVLGKSVHGWSGIRLRPEPKEGDPDDPDQPAPGEPRLSGWAGKPGTYFPDAGSTSPDPEDLFGGAETRADRARRASGGGNE
ncbi:MAG: phage/plasmid primase, P4 family [Thermoplasmata archaeon]|nr:phage/plasmid primase, P4 family [Thermoplasmata archaeon]